MMFHRHGNYIAEYYYGHSNVEELIDNDVVHPFPCLAVFCVIRFLIQLCQ